MSNPFDKKRYIECALEVLNVHNWQVSISEVDSIDADADAAGECESNARYRWSRVRILKDIDDEDDLREILVHEACHIPHAQLDYVVRNRIINDHIDKYKRQTIAEEQYADALEPFIVILASAIRPYVDAMYDGEECHGDAEATKAIQGQ